MTKNAYLIITHSDVDMFSKLITELGIEDDIYVHVDAKRDIKAFKNSVKNKQNVWFIENRKAISWAGFTMVEAMTELLKVSSENFQYGHFIFLSGLDYPIRDIDSVRNYFISKPDTEFIRAYSITDCECEHCHRKVEEYHFRDKILKNNRLDKIIRNLLKIVFFPKHKKILNINNKDMNIAYGSQWFALTYECVKYILNYIEENKNVLNKYFKTVFAPDEIFFHTIIFNSKFANRTLNKGFESYSEEWSLNNYHWLKTNDLSCTLFKNLTIKSRINSFIKMKNNNTEEKGSISFLNENDFCNILNSKYMFMRKVSTSNSLELIKRIDEKRKEVSK